MHTSALVLFSGGQDSTTCLALALSKYERVETIAFDYTAFKRELSGLPNTFVPGRNFLPLTPAAAVKPSAGAC